jgi:hypothetical protein
MFFKKRYHEGSTRSATILLIKEKMAAQIIVAQPLKALCLHGKEGSSSVDYKGPPFLS